MKILNVSTGSEIMKYRTSVLFFRLLQHSTFSAACQHLFLLSCKVYNCTPADLLQKHFLFSLVGAARTSIAFHSLHSFCEANSPIILHSNRMGLSLLVLLSLAGLAHSNDIPINCVDVNLSFFHIFVDDISTQ